MTSPLENKSALVTGGGSGIGLACASSFAKDGANVLIMGRNLQKLENAATALHKLSAGGEVNIFQGDVGKEADVQAAVEAASVDGNLDITVANAGIGGLAPLMVTESDSWDAIMQTNLTGTFYTIKHAGKAMARSGGGHRSPSLS